MANRINKAIELLAADQPIYYVGGHTGHVLTHAQGKVDASTWADYINVGMEHGAFNLAGLDDYLRGLIDGGPTASGHRTPTVIVEAPVEGVSREVVAANAWQFRQILGRGVHGILLCQAETTGAVQAFVESCRYPVNQIGVETGLGVGTRGVGSEASAAAVWGVDPSTYLDTADPWPLNPDGELLLGIKIESKAALPHIEELLAVPGIGFAEMGPFDMSLSLGYRWLPEPWPNELDEAHARVKQACAQNGVAFHDNKKTASVESMIDSGANIFFASPDDVDFVRAGRAHSKRTMPV